MIQIPTHFAERMRELHGTEGEGWLSRLPALVAACAQRWSLEVLPPFEPLSYNYVAPARRADGGYVVLKIGVLNPELLSEIDALRYLDGNGIVRLLEADREQGILLLERLTPGVPLKNMEDDAQATSIAIQVMRQLWQPAPAEHTFPTVAKWARGMDRLRETYNGGTGPFPKTLVDTAENLFSEMISSMSAPVLLHGDLHHENILSATRQPWLALDPKGVIGERAYETGAFLRNPLLELLSMPDPRKITSRRVDQMVEELGFEAERILGWALAQAVLSAWWMIEDHGHGWEPAIAMAEIFASLISI